MHGERTKLHTNAGWSKWLGVWLPLSKVLGLSLMDGKNRHWGELCPLIWVHPA